MDIIVDSRYEVIRVLTEATYITRHLSYDAITDLYVVLSQLHVDDKPDHFNKHIEAASSLNNSRIVALVDHRFNDVPYVTRVFMPGSTLRQVIRMKGRLSLEEAARYIKRIATGLDYAHQEGVIHAGLHPELLLRDSHDKFYISDFGISRYLLDTVGPRKKILPYIAPEVFRRVPCSQTVDVYALGAILCEMLTGFPPFRGTSYAQLFDAHLNRSVPSILDLRPDLPYHAQEIINKAMNKMPNLRYGRAGDLAADLQGLAEGSGKPRKKSHDRSSIFFTPEGMYRFDQSEKASFNSSSVTQMYADALIMEGENPDKAAAMYRRIIELQPQRTQGEVAQRLARLEQDQGLQRVPNMLVEAREARDSGDWPRVEQIAREALTFEADNDHAHELYEVGSSMAAAAYHYHTAEVAAAIGYWDAAILLLRELYDAYPHYHDVSHLRSIGAGNVSALQELSQVQAHQSQVMSASFSADGTRVATGSTDKNVHIWTMPDLAHLSTVGDHPSWVCNTVFSPTHDVLLSGTWEGLIKLWQLPEGEYWGTIAGLTSQVRAMKFSQFDPRILATASGYFLTLWEMPEGKRLAILREDDRQPVTALDFSGIENWLVTGLNNGMVRVRDMGVADYPPIFEVQVSTGPIYSVACSPVDLRVATSSRDGTVYISDLEHGEVLTEIVGHQDVVQDVSFSADGSVLATAGRDGYALLSRVDTGEVVLELEAHQGEVRCATFSPDGQYLITTGGDGLLRSWGLL